MYPEQFIAKLSSFLASMDQVVTARALEFVFATEENLVALHPVGKFNLENWLRDAMSDGLEIIGILVLDQDGEFDFLVVHTGSLGDSAPESTEREEREVLSFKENFLRRCEAFGQITRSVRSDA